MIDKTTDKQLNEVLDELGREHRAVTAPDSLERVLCAAVDSRKAAVEKSGMRFAWAWAAVAILLAVVTTAGVIWRAQKTHQAQLARSVPASKPQFSPGPLPPSPGPAHLSVQPKSAPVRAVMKPRVPLRAPSPPQAPTSSSLDEFVPLPVSEGLPAAAALSIVRMKLRGSDLQQYGLQAPADAFARPLLAEFAVGEDGLPRAIRIVR
jgi:hypothetical protein